MVEDTAAGVQFKGVNKLITDTRVGLRELTVDIARGRINLSGGGSLVVLLGRADIAQDRDIVAELQRLAETVKDKYGDLRIQVSGPFPMGNESEHFLQRMLQAVELVAHATDTLENLRFLNILQVFIRDLGLVKALINSKGLTLNGIVELRDSIM